MCFFFLLFFVKASHNELTGDGGAIESPMYPKNYLIRRTNEDISWRVMVDSGFAISFKFDKLEYLSYEECFSIISVSDFRK